MPSCLQLSALTNLQRLSVSYSHGAWSLSFDHLTRLSSLSRLDLQCVHCWPDGLELLTSLRHLVSQVTLANCLVNGTVYAFVSYG